MLFGGDHFELSIFFRFKFSRVSSSWLWEKKKVILSNYYLYNSASSISKARAILTRCKKISEYKLPSRVEK